jgi:hypothetical protein
MLNMAVTVTSVVILITHGSVAEHPPPLHPVKTDPGLAAAVRVMDWPSEYDSIQSNPQLIPAGLLVTVPDPKPDLTTLSSCMESLIRLNVAVTVISASIVNEHVLVPEHPPPTQPAKVESGSAWAVKVTTLPWENTSEQSLPQLMPVGLLVIVPDPEPNLAALRP